MKLSHISTVAGILMLSLSSYAANVKSSNINLVGGTISPRETLAISTDKLLPGGSYKVTCKITDPNNKNNPVILNVNATGEGGASCLIVLNDTWIGGPQFSLPQVDNTIQITNVYNNRTPIKILNLDQTDSVKFSDCVAVAQAGNN